MKSHEKGNGNAAAKPAKSAQPPPKASENSSQAKSQLEKPVSFVVGYPICDRIRFFLHCFLFIVCSF